MRNTKCIVCSRKIFKNNSINLCTHCVGDPYIIEEARDLLALKSPKKFKKLYSARYPEIKDLNTSMFWDKKMEKVLFLKDQDGMTRDRVNTAFQYLDKGSKKILDIGAGKGYLEELASKQDLDIYANDFSKQSVNNLTKRFIGNYKVMSVFSLKYPRRNFDAVFILEVLEHIPPKKVFKVLKSINNLLKMNGQLIVSVPMNEGLKYMKENINGHVRTYTENVITTELKISGFKIIETKKIYAFKNLYMVKSFIARLFPKKWKPNNIIINARKIK